MNRLLTWIGIGWLARWVWLAWTAPKDWAAQEYVTATNLNTHLRDNLNALKSPASDHYELNEGSEYSGAAAWADIDSTNLAFTLVTAGGDVMAHFHGTFYTSTSTAPVYLDVDVDGPGNRIAGDDGIIGASLSTTATPVTFTRLIPDLAAGSHTFNLQWNAAANVRLAAGSGATHDVHPQFWVREVS